MERRRLKGWHWLVLGLAVLAIIGGIAWAVNDGSKQSATTQAPTVTAVEYRAPPYCGNAIADAREILALVDQLPTAAGKVSELAVGVAKAGEQQNASEIRGLALQLRAISNDAKEQAGRIQALRPRFDRHADACIRP